MTPADNAAPGAADPSMDDILASIRRILAEDETAGSGPPPVPEVEPEPAAHVLELSQAMIVEEAPPAPPPPVAPPAPHPAAPPIAPMPASTPQPAPFPPPQDQGPLIAPEAAAASAASVQSLMRHLANERSLAVTRQGPSLEDVIRDEIRPLLKLWLDTNLPGMVERLVQNEIGRVVGRSVG